VKHLTMTLITLSLVALLLGACVPPPASPPMPIASPVVAPAATETAAGPSAPAGEWQTYTDAEVGFSIQVPTAWSNETLPDQNGGAIHGMAFTGPEGGVEVYWGVGFGGACPNGTEPVQLAQGELPACHATNADGTEVWSQIGYEVSGGNSFSVRAYTSDAQPSSHDLVLQVLATLTFMPPAQPQAGTDGPSTAAVPTATPATAADLLPSWNPGPAKNTILQFVADVTDQAGPSYVPPADRIAVFDNDGTLWTEKPIPVQADFVFQRIVDLAPEHPEWQTTQPYQAVLEQDVETLQSLSAEEVEELVFATHAGMTEEEFDATVKAFLATAKHPRFGVPYTETVYQPMLELLAFLQANGFKTFIVSGGGVEFMRAFSEEVYGIPREKVIGSSLQYEFQQTSDGSVLIRQPEMVSFDDRAMKPANIQLDIGRRPILAGGNSNGDLEMFQYTGGDEGPFLDLAIVHDDAEREYDYLTNTDELMTAAAQNPWMFVSMKNDFKTVFPTPAGAAAASPATPTARVPLKDALDTLEPQDVWQNFYDLTQIPRPSHHEEQVRDFLAQFGRDLGLETIVDDVGNVLIRKPASPGMEGRQGVILQAHMDMVPQKTPDSTHDFLTDPIDAYVDGEWVVADGTTLGADDGSGIAIAMGILQSQTVSLGPIEALFTVNEEDGLDGALGLQPGVLQGSILINLDSENEGEFTIGSAGGEYANIETTYAETAVPAGVTAYTVSVSGLQGGHSGVDINLGRGHAVKLLVRLLSAAAGEYGVRVAQITGGTAANAIPRDASALVVVPAAQADAFLKGVQEFEGIVRSELAAVEPDLKVQATPADMPGKVMDETAQRTLLDALYGTPQGVIRMSDAVPDLVETSTNMGIVDVGDGQVEVTCLSRSSVDSELEDVGQMIASVWDLAGVEVVLSGGYSGWNPNPDSPILLLMEDVYKTMYGQDPSVTAIHAGLECGTIVSKYPGMDAISIGPTLQNVHTPNERLLIATVKKLNDFLLETLKQIPEKSTTESGAQAPVEEATPVAEQTPSATITATQVITYVPGSPTGEPREGSCWTNSLAVWREDAWRCTVGNDIFDPCFAEDGSVICGANPTTTTVSFALTLTEPLPAPEVPPDTANHAWLVELADGTVCEFATGATGGVGDERINYFCPSSDPTQSVVILGDLQPGTVWMASWAVLTGSMPDLTVLESAEMPIRTVWR